MIISRSAMMQGIQKVHGAAVPFVSMFHRTASTYLWEDDEGTTHKIVQGEGGEQGDAMMPLLFSLGQHPALEEVQAQLIPGEFLFAYLDDIIVISTPEHVAAGIRIHQSKTKIWNRAGEKPAVCDVLEHMARIADPTACVYLEGTTADHQLLLDRIPLLGDLQSLSLLLVYCAAARADNMSRVVEPDAAREFCRRHDAAVWRCFCTFTQIEEWQPRDVRDTASMPLVLGGLGLRSASRTSKPAYWASWADCLSMVQRRHPHVAAVLQHRRPSKPHPSAEQS